ncbi:hypothetical protein LINPERHAP1_LOCUS4952, partial [Linum perenne]
RNLCVSSSSSAAVSDYQKLLLINDLLLTSSIQSTTTPGLSLPTSSPESDFSHIEIRSRSSNSGSFQLTLFLPLLNLMPQFSIPITRDHFFF